LNQNLKEALDFAIAKEREAEVFYKEWAAKVRSPAVVALFAELAATEHGHFEMLSHLTPEDLAAVGASGKVGDLKLSELLIDVEASEGMDVQEAMILAMKREQSAAALYDELARLGGETRSLFSALAKEERRHKQKLETQYDEEILTEN
jgi:rubrerythrin